MRTDLHAPTARAPRPTSSSSPLPRLRRAAVLALALLAAACAGGVRGPRHTLAMELGARPALFYGGSAEAVNVGETVYDFMRRREPMALRTREVIPGARTNVFEPPIGVYVDGQFAGGLEVLQTILASDVLAVRRLHASEVGALRQRQHTDGVVDIVLRR